MKAFTPSVRIRRDSDIPKKVARDWEELEALATAIEAAESRRQAVEQALENGPRFRLHRLPLNFWVAVLPDGEMSEGQRGRLSTADAQIVEPAAKFADAITGCTDLHRVGDHILFFRSNLPEAEIRENIDLSFLPF